MPIVLLDKPELFKQYETVCIELEGHPRTLVMVRKNERSVPLGQLKTKDALR